MSITRRISEESFTGYTNAIETTIANFAVIKSLLKARLSHRNDGEQGKSLRWSAGGVNIRVATAGRLSYYFS